MATRNTIFRNSQPISPAVCGFVLFSLCVNAVDAAAAQLSHLLCALTGEVFKVLPSIMLLVFQAFEAYAFDDARFPAICRVLVWAWPLLHLVFLGV
jgi:hypothetical protein